MFLKIICNCSILKLKFRFLFLSKKKIKKGMIAEKSCIDIVVQTFNMVLLDQTFKEFDEKKKISDKGKEETNTNYYETYMDENGLDGEEEIQKVETFFPFWKSDQLKNLIEDSFPSSLSKEESNQQFNLKPLVDLSYLFSRIQHQNGIVLEESAKKQLENETNSFEFVYSDVVMSKFF